MYSVWVVHPSKEEERFRRRMLGELLLGDSALLPLGEGCGWYWVLLLQGEELMVAALSGWKRLEEATSSYLIKIKECYSRPKI